eukprot:TRINITY_DN1293_c0_g1_i1.p1 TRINITY_DN1293_c0_g1~~TRINITY_DN1293_c0_g1_i1.p1  ORF type:complete len:643 (-),score=291.96 TRINITY_DN1293_c0_g1_i1:29-1957(-)
MNTERKSRILSALDPSEIIHINPAATSKMIDDIANGTAYNLDRLAEFSSLPSRQYRSVSVSASVPKHIREADHRVSRQLLPEEWINQSSSSGKMEISPEAPASKSSKIQPATRLQRPSKASPETTEKNARPKTVMGEDTLRGMNADPTIKPAMKRKLNYNSIRMLPRVNSNSPHSSVREEESNGKDALKKSESIIEEYKSREEALDKRIRKVLSTINSERFELSKMAATFKQKLEEEEAKNRKLQLKNQDLKVLIKSLRSEKSKEHSLVEAAELKNRQISEAEAEANRKIHQLERNLEEENEKNANLSHRILFLEAKLEKEQQNQQVLQQQIIEKFSHIEEELKNRSPPTQVRSQMNQPAEGTLGSPLESIQIKGSPPTNQKQPQFESPNGRLHRSYSIAHSPFAKGKKEKKEMSSPKKEHSPKGGIFGSVKNLLRSSSSSKGSPMKTRDRSESAPVVPQENVIENAKQEPNIIESPKKIHHSEAIFKSPGVAPRVPDRSHETINESNTIRNQGNVILGSKKRSSNFTILALYDYASRAEDDLDFQEGDLLTLHKRYSDGWWLAEMRGKLGRVPSNYFLDLSKVEPTRMMALGDFTGECESDLSFKRGQLIKVYVSEDDWWVGEAEGIVGYLPSNFVRDQRF